ncbi:GPI-anchored protein LLG1-like [Cucurbita pepo subsp. pepo]|uniref:GPI-anchored protein LLG1-like n=1 Tax=Cucurbita pepo subsp. pepo TaxID=3664 RepID=UPI000C9D72AF|nr:GPI-anchored protein LLG1-like [Cucurbita pepo subsp. pepo]
MNKMESHRCSSLFLLLFLSILFVGAFASEHIIGSTSLTTRTILQAKKACPVNFEVANYTIITSKCKGPKYTANLCCSALAEFACPYAKYLNDLTNNCASTMFTYINLYGKYPPGLFSTLCKGKGRKGGLQCPKAN